MIPIESASPLYPSKGRILCVSASSGGWGNKASVPNPAMLVCTLRAASIPYFFCFCGAAVHSAKTATCPFLTWEVIIAACYFLFCCSFSSIFAGASWLAPNGFLTHRESVTVKNWRGTFELCEFTKPDTCSPLIRCQNCLQNKLCLEAVRLPSRLLDRNPRASRCASPKHHSSSTPAKCAVHRNLRLKILCSSDRWTEWSSAAGKCAGHK